MAIKRIQLRGISRTPSDRANEDGGCAESLNVQLDQGETAPVVPPVDVTEDPSCYDDYGLPPASERKVYDILYNHKQNNYSHFICQQGREIGVWTDNNLSYDIYLTLCDAVLDPLYTDAVNDVADQLQDWLDDYDQVHADLQAWRDAGTTGEPIFIGRREYEQSAIDDRDEMLAALVEYIKPPQESGLPYYHFDATVEEVFIPRYHYELLPFLTLQSDEEVKDVVSIGNTLVIYTNKSPHYCLFNGERYEYLGSELPTPKIRISTEDGLPGRHARKYSQMYGEGMVEEEVEHGTDYKSGITPEKISQAYNEARRSVSFGAPAFVRYAIRLFDGTYIKQSIPILVCGGHEFVPDVWYHVIKEYMGYESYKYYRCIGVRLLLSSVRAQLYNSDEIAKWGDIIESIDFFSSEPIFNPFIASDGTTQIAGYEPARESPSGGIIEECKDIKMASRIEELEDLEQEVLTKSVFYKILIARKKVLAVDNIDDVPQCTIDELTGTGHELFIPNNLEKLVERETLNDDFDSNMLMTGTSALNFNDRIVLSGVVQRLAPGYCSLPGSVKILRGADQAYKDWKFSLKFFITGANNGGVMDMLRGAPIYNVLMESYQGGNVVTVESYVNPADGWTIESFFGWLAYPSPNCNRVVMHLQVGQENYYREIEMIRHPRLNCSYAFLGFDTMINSTTGRVASSDGFLTESRYMPMNNKLAVSEASNPFLFQAEGRYTFDSKVIAAAVANRELSQGQYGQFPLYVFTEGGIYAMETTSLGTFSKRSVVSRDVALNKDCITPIDQAIVFITKRGVMCISGSQIVELSPNMNGKHFAIDNATKTLLEADSSWRDYVPAISDAAPFMEFMSNSMAVYDYAGQRLIFINKDTGSKTKKYQYVYKFNTQTWHKLSHTGVSEHITRVINTYPDAFVQVGGLLLSESTRLVNLSTFLDVQAPTSNKGVIITRSIDFDMPDVRKSLNALRIRGEYDNLQNVKYLVWGSMDRVSWKRLTSLRGGSYKYFRIMILSELQPTERITYIECDVGERWNNKLR